MCCLGWSLLFFQEEKKRRKEKRREAKGKGEEERYIHLNAELQRIAKRDKRKRPGDCDDIHVAILKMNKQQGPTV